MARRKAVLTAFLFGRTSRDLDVTDLMWRFFEQAGRSLPQPAGTAER